MPSKRRGVAVLPGIRSSLELRMIVLAGTGLLAAFVLFLGLSIWTIDEGVRRTLEERRVLAVAISDRVASLLQENLEALQGASFPALVGSPNSNPELLRRTLHDTYLRTIFRGGVYFLNVEGQVLLAEPPEQDSNLIARRPYVLQAVQSGKPIITDAYFTPISGAPMISALIPVRDGIGAVVGVLGGDIDPADRRLQDIIRPLAIGSTGYAQLVDSQGTIFEGKAGVKDADNHQQQELSRLVRQRQTDVGSCHDCHFSGGIVERVDEVIAVAPVAGTPWGVVVRQSAEEALMPSQRLRQILLLGGAPLFLLSLAVAWATARSVVRPLAALARSAEGIASGDLDSPVPQAGDDEVGRLARTFEVMRHRLKQSVLQIKGWNAELEERVRQRTLQLQEQETLRRDLLHKVISAQEEERRRIARELHDETSQSLAALIVALETATMAVGDSEPARQRLGVVKSLGVQVLDGVHELIFDLRPSLLDDLGLAAAIRWYAESRLPAAGINVSVEISGNERRLPSEIETTLFRTMQEAITNVAKHSCADTAVVRVELLDDRVVAEVEDDGRGFDPAAVAPEPGKMRGLGLLGMSERVGLLQGQMAVLSRPGQGTRLRFEVPIHVDVAKEIGRPR